jgi:serine phosphatase RsbU (regulator of sigma subunit)/PAS domain-containing protein
MWLDEAAMAIFAVEPHDFVPRIDFVTSVVHPDDLPPTMAALDKSLQEGSLYEAEFRVQQPSGGYGWIRARGRVEMDDEGEPARMIGTVWDSDESRSTRDALSRAVRHMSDGFLSVDDTWRVTFVNLEAERVLGSFEEEMLGRVLWDLPAVRRVPGLEARCREAVRTTAPAGFDVWMKETGHCYNVRLVPGSGGHTLYFANVTERRRHEEEKANAERAASERAVQIAELTGALAKAMTVQDVVKAVAERILPFSATGLVMQVIEGNRLHNVGAAGHCRTPFDRLEGRPEAASDPRWESILTGKPVFVSSLEQYRAHHEPAEPSSPADKRGAAFLPLTASGQTFGVWVVTFDRPRHLTEEQRSLLTTISALVAQALERARLYDAEHTRSRELQRSLLPRELPDVSACTTAARYLPAEQDMDVGGDWYDVIPLSAGRVAIVIGDVMGHGLRQAATMGRLRTAVHTLAGLELPPDEIMSHLNDIVSELEEDSYATCAYVLYDSTSRTCQIVRAGHLPPAVVQPDGTVYFPGSVPDPPLGAAEPPFETLEVVVPEESLLVLYSDGLIESAMREIDRGMDSLAEILRTTDGEDLERLCDTLTTRLLPPGQPTTDDAALLVARLHALPVGRMAVWPLPDDPRAAGEARRHVREQLALWGLDHLAMTTELLASELVGNVVRHAKGPLQLRLLYSAELVCEASDGSLTMPRIRRASDMDEGGRGLQLIAALSQRWGTRYTPTGKCIWTAQSLSETESLPLDFMPTV